jgi:hypothetical protein
MIQPVVTASAADYSASLTPNGTLTLANSNSRGCFKDAVHAANAYEEVKHAQNPQTAAMMWTLWIEEVRQRSTNPFEDPTTGVRAEGFRQVSA